MRLSMTEPSGSRAQANRHVTFNHDRLALAKVIAYDQWYTRESQSWGVSDYVFYRALYFQRVLRHAEYWENRDGRLASLILNLYKVRLALLGERVGVHIPRHTCGPGLSIAHPGGIVVNGQARLGARCRISQGVTIGATPAGAPTLGDDVFIGPNAQVIGRVTVGAGSTVLPGAVVTKDVPPASTVGGVPATVLRRESDPWHVSMKPVASPPAVLAEFEASRGETSGLSDS
jgi:serine O-acetyltransferase